MKYINIKKVRYLELNIDYIIINMKRLIFHFVKCIYIYIYECK